MSVDSLIQDALEWGRFGNKQQARALLIQAVQQDPENARAWFLLSQTVEKDLEALDCLRRVEALQPGNPQVQARIAAIEERLASQTIPPLDTDWHRPLREQMPWVSRGEPVTPPHGVPPVQSVRSGAFAWEAPPKTAMDWTQPQEEQLLAGDGNLPPDLTADLPAAAGKARSQSRSTPPDRSSWAKAALALGLGGLVSWCLPIFGLLIPLAGLTLGMMSRATKQRDLATAAIGLSLIALMLACAGHGLAAAYLWLNWKP